VTVAPVTRRARKIRSEVPVGRAEGLGRSSVINVDNVLTVPKDLLEPDPIGRLGEAASKRLDVAIRWTLDIRH
jgi:mRNA-degrading endonuclease toxin of MazEF toxin-antitoxin module